MAAVCKIVGSTLAQPLARRARSTLPSWSGFAPEWPFCMRFATKLNNGLTVAESAI